MKDIQAIFLDFDGIILESLTANKSLWLLYFVGLEIEDNCNVDKLS